MTDVHAFAVTHAAPDRGVLGAPTSRPAGPSSLSGRPFAQVLRIVTLHAR